MDQEQEKYEKVIQQLRRSKPDYGDMGQFSEKVIRRIQKERTTVSVAELLYEFIFGWVYIGWIRKSMVIASICLVIYFGYQQTEMAKKVDALSSRSLVNVELMNTGMNTTLPVTWKVYTIFGKGAVEDRMEILEMKLDKFNESVKDLQKQYEDISRFIENDPDSKKYVEERLIKNETVKTKI